MRSFPNLSLARLSAVPLSLLLVAVMVVVTNVTLGHVPDAGDSPDPFSVPRQRSAELAEELAAPPVVSDLAAASDRVLVDIAAAVVVPEATVPATPPPVNFVPATDALPAAVADAARWEAATLSYNAALAALGADRSALALAQVSYAAASDDVALAEAYVAAAASVASEVDVRFAAASTELRASAGELELRRDALADFAVSGFVEGSTAVDALTGMHDPFVAAFTGLSTDELMAEVAAAADVHERALVSTADLASLRSTAWELHSFYVGRLGRLRQDLDVAYSRLGTAERTFFDAERATSSALDELEKVRASLTPVPLAAPSGSVSPVLFPSIPPGAGDSIGGVPTLALDGYLKATARMAVLDSSCGLAWWQLAGFGSVESNHGRYGGSSFDAYGNVTPPIIGIPLDGTNDTALIWDTDDGVLDGDPVYDRAVGPNQFIPSTWAYWASDGDGDGFANPHNYYDASLASARYLCASRGGGSMTDDSGAFTRATLAYNYSYSYVAAVSIAGAYIKSTVTPLLIS